MNDYRVMDKYIWEKVEEIIYNLYKNFYPNYKDNYINMYCTSYQFESKDLGKAINETSELLFYLEERKQTVDKKLDNK